ncbi:hypothetical protein [Streptomyces sp. NPDC051546]|uniref:hypothetical protein n=1 Tax=Streptomyces sp. NPDC051546 TaxID=3365655 RepID=UPI0037925A54
MGSQTWTPDSIAHALPSGMRQEFLKQFNLTPIGDLEKLGEKWVEKVINPLQAAAERGRELHAYQQEHGGQLPGQYTDVTSLIVESQAA